ncbi:cadherin-like domain-containing protein, partial [Neptunomonas marina]|uniref:cadherin-like domain-containing protein n=1 Tax=Neptunomonas marina TaxID=1815562 RepID=UPI0013E2F609
DLTSIVITQQPDHGTLVVNSNGTVTYTPDTNYNGPDSFQYTIADAAGNVSNAATVNLTVTPDNDPPVAVDD